MDLITNSTFRILKEPTPSTKSVPGTYRVIVRDQIGRTIVAVLIRSEGEQRLPRGGRSKKADASLRFVRKKPRQPLVGKLIWIDQADLDYLAENQLLKPIDVERVNVQELSASSEAIFRRRLKVMQPFLDIKNLQEKIAVHGGLAGIVEEVSQKSGASKAFVYRQWSNLCLWGISAPSLRANLHRCGARGVRRYSGETNGSGKPRLKAGRKTAKQRIHHAYGVRLDPEQPGMTREWAAAIRAADNCIPSPKGSWRRRCDHIISSAFCSKALESPTGEFQLVKPEIGKYPNEKQIIRVLTIDKTRLERIQEQTTKRHFEMARRGLTARNWQGVAGPGHTWEIDSTVGDIYLRSSVNRAWIIGRPIVYILVDKWSTAIVGFYVCLTGPSWATAKVSLFNALADPKLLGQLWGYQPMLTLTPHPTMCYSLMCDRGEYLSRGHRETALKLIPSTSYAPPYRGDLKGLVEVLHRIEKDRQFLFIPGAMDFRRQELELRRVNPEDCVFTVRDYTQYLYEIFSDYNLTADRRHRLDAYMIADGVVPSPAGLWAWGHQMGIGYRIAHKASDLIGELLPRSTARVRRDCVRYAGNDFMSQEIAHQQWTAIARNCGGWDIPVSYYPGAMRYIWTPDADGVGMHQLAISDQARASAEHSYDEWLDCRAVQTMQGPSNDHLAKMNSLDALARVQALREHAAQITKAALKKASGTAPTMSEARTIELAENHASRSEKKVTEELLDEGMTAHEEMMEAFLQSASGKD